MQEDFQNTGKEELDVQSQISSLHYIEYRSFCRIWSHLLKKPLMENIIFLCSVISFLRIRNCE